MKDGTVTENRSLIETILGSKITFTMLQRIIITDCENLYCDGEWTLTIPLRAFEELIGEDFSGDRNATIEHLCDRSSNWRAKWYRFNRGIGGQTALQHGI